MAAKKRVAKAGATAYGAAQSRYVQRLIEDDELRANIAHAVESAKRAYDRLSNGKSPTKVVFDDKRFQRDVREAAWSARDATVGLREGPKKRKRRGGIGRLLLLLIIGAIAAVALSEGLRKRVLDLLFGAEEEFEYTSTTTTPTPPVSSSAANPASPTT
jgi:hypothetical protein